MLKQHLIVSHVLGAPKVVQLGLDDIGGTNFLTLDWNETSSTDRALNFKVNAGDRTIDLSGNLTLSGANTVATWASSGAIEANSAGATGEIGIDFNSISSTYSTICQSDAEGIASSSDLRIALSPTTRNLILCDTAGIADDGGLTASTHPTLYLAYAGANLNTYSSFNWEVANLKVGSTSQYIFASRGGIKFRLDVSDKTIGNVFDFTSLANIELTDADAEQAWMYLEPKINQTSTAGYIGLLMDVTEISTGSGTNALMDLRVATASKFMVNNLGNVGVGVSAFGTSGTNVLGITADGTVPSTSPAGMVQIFADDSSGGATNATLAIRTEETVTSEVLAGNSTLNIWINGTEYHLILRTV